MTRKQKALIDARISRVYGQRCSGVQISVMDMGKVMAVAQTAVAAGVDDQALGDAIAAYVETIRKN